MLEFRELALHECVFRIDEDVEGFRVIETRSSENMNDPGRILGAGRAYGQHPEKSSLGVRVTSRKSKVDRGSGVCGAGGGEGGKR